MCIEIRFLLTYHFLKRVSDGLRTLHSVLLQSLHLVEKNLQDIFFLSFLVVSIFQVEFMRQDIHLAVFFSRDRLDFVLAVRRVLPLEVVKEISLGKSELFPSISANIILNLCKLLGG